MARYLVCGIDEEGVTELFESESRVEAISFLDDYVSTEDAGGWNLIEAQDTVTETTIHWWERDEVE